jgi:hypothetical protein
MSIVVNENNKDVDFFFCLDSPNQVRDRSQKQKFELIIGFRIYNLNFRDYILPEKIPGN